MRGGDQCAGPASELRWLGWDVLADCAYRQLLLRLASFKCRDSLDGCYRSWDTDYAGRFVNGFARYRQVDQVLGEYCGWI